MSTKLVKVREIINELYGGLSLKKALQLHSMSGDDFFETMNQNPLLYDFYNRVQLNKAEMIVEDMIEIADDQSIDPTRARVMVDARKWYASKMKPQKYGERIELNIHTVDITTALNDARSRALPSRYQQEAIDAELVDTKQLTQSVKTDVESVSPPQNGDAVQNTSDDIFD